MEITAITPKQLAERWQISIAKVYEDNNAGKLPQIPNNKNRFSLEAIEQMEREAIFERCSLKTPLERKLRKELDEKNILLSKCDETIKELQGVIARIQALSIQAIYPKDIDK
jgi:predicted site-specific integrase-resolvase